MNDLIQTIDGLQEILAICPCCGEVFRMVDAKFIFPAKRARSCEYLDLVALEDHVAEEDFRLTAAQEKFAKQLEAQRRQLAELGRRMAKKRMKKIDPVFSVNKIDPQDVKVIFEPVEYIIFHGLNSESGVKLIELVSRQPDTTALETTLKSIDRTIESGNVEFETLRMQVDGSFKVTKAK
ncbi:MAG: hypothetical protein LAP21_09470 [Acidobacteriia bacterium]|nr:hypothetical protein [Terriglobia bacterium]